jgi:hypothetical protein
VWLNIRVRLEPNNCLLGTAVQESIKLAYSSSEAYKKAWAGRLFVMLDNVVVKRI